MQLNFGRSSVVSAKKSWSILALFTILTVCLRWGTFYPSVIDWDESLYILVAKAWSDGNLPYTAVWDNKPPGIYLIFLAAISTLSHSVVAVRIFACIFIAITSLFVYKIGNLVENNGDRVGLLAGILYIITTLSNGGLSANTEIFFTSFVVVAIYLFFSNNFYSEELTLKKKIILLSIGLLLGLSFEIKYVVLFDFFALSLILISTFILNIKYSNKFWLIAKNLALISLGFILPFIVFSLYFWISGHFGEYFYANFTANKLRTIDIEFSFFDPFKAIYEKNKIDIVVLLTAPFLAVAYFFISKKKSMSDLSGFISIRDKWLVLSFIAWLFTDLMGICILYRGSFYGHYFLQVLPSLCLIIAYIIVNFVFLGAGIKRFKFKQYLILGLLLVVLTSTTGIFKALNSGFNYIYFRHIQGDSDWGDTPSLIAKYLKPKINADDYIYIVHDVPIVYFLANAKIPTRYAFPPFLLIQPDLPNITGVNPLQELDNIFEKQPVYIIKRKVYQDIDYSSNNQVFLNKLDRNLKKNYKIETSIATLDLYRLNTKP